MEEESLVLNEVDRKKSYQMITIPKRIKIGRRKW